MFKSATLLLVALATASAQDASRPIITTTGGQVQGITASCGLFCSYFQFNGIPYAEPPVGDLRFRNPVPHRGWSGVRDASDHGQSCPSLSPLSEYSGGEDCLFINVYSQNLIGSRPVMVWIHGGAFVLGNGDSRIYGPDHLVQENVVVVSFNYRLGILGFFSTGDTQAQGNWGLKDCVEALRWVRANIAAFGGDPNNVTIFGESAGGVMVHFMTLSPMTAGLFHKAIAQSGTALVPWGFQYNPREMSRQIADAFGYPHDTAELTRLLRYTPIAEFVALQRGITDIPIPRGFKPFEYVPSAEPVNSPEPTFITQRPIEILLSGAYNHVPIMFGHTNAESLFMVREHAVDSTVWNEFTRNPGFFVPHFWNIPAGTSEASAVSQAFRNFYWQDRPLGPAINLEWTTFHTDQQFIYAIDKTVRLTADRSPQSTYYYQFSFDGDLNLIKRLLLLTDFPGAVHADELPYLFSMSNLPVTPILPSNHANVVRQRMVRLWTNFAITGRPTPNSDTALQNIQWAPVQGGNMAYLDIGHDLVPGNNPNQARIALWKDLEDRYANDPFFYPYQ
ncbi:cholinesterase [Culex quinquefasciatus]|uniref:Carboxylic ester hydrolase n=1 Tax=Culex quinquefasciatus TaxID=7176 RepID=B0XFI2_CULQU|nr:carboxylesterase 4A [Culex quinquefasciatus]EDS26820.1 cholinesterase [Culex quinquefasciatus]|eukprot:XP_001868404.1 cholinesterase [Culex quinquefasciatus]